jgi:hypothetical protein
MLTPSVVMMSVTIKSHYAECRGTQYTGRLLAYFQILDNTEKA